jgi:hypothetical protein
VIREKDFGFCNEHGCPVIGDVLSPDEPAAICTLNHRFIDGAAPAQAAEAGSA